GRANGSIWSGWLIEKYRAVAGVPDQAEQCDRSPRVAALRAVVERADPAPRLGRSRPARFPIKHLARDQLLERGLVADRIEVRIALRVLAEGLRHLDRAPEVVEGIARPAGEALDAGDVVQQTRILRIRLGQRPAALGGLGVLAGLVQRAERSPELPAVRLVCLSRDGADRHDRRPGLLGERRSLHAGTSEHECAGRALHPLAIELEHRAPLQDEVELLVPVRFVLVVLVDDPVARGTCRPRVDAEGRDAEVVPDGSHGTPAVVDLVDLVEVRDRVRSHMTPLRRRPRRQSAMRNATLYFVTDARRPGVSPAGIAFRASSPRR